MSSLLLDTPLTAEQTTYVKAVEDIGDALSSLIEESWTIPKIEAARSISRSDRSRLPADRGHHELLAPRAQPRTSRSRPYVETRCR